MDRPNRGISRRTFVKGAAAAGGIAWAAPQILSQPAFAIQCPPTTCPAFYQIQIGDDGCADAGNAQGVECLSAIDPDGGSVQSGGCTKVFSSSWSESGGEITLVAGCAIVEAFTKKGSSSGGTLECGALTPTNNCRTVTFGENSHVELAFCCDS